MAVGPRWAAPMFGGGLLVSEALGVFRIDWGYFRHMFCTHHGRPQNWRSSSQIAKAFQLILSCTYAIYIIGQSFPTSLPFYSWESFPLAAPNTGRHEDTHRLKKFLQSESTARGERHGPLPRGSHTPRTTRTCLFGSRTRSITITLKTLILQRTLRPLGCPEPVSPPSPQESPQATQTPSGTADKRCPLYRKCWWRGRRSCGNNSARECEK